VEKCPMNYINRPVQVSRDCILDVLGSILGLGTSDRVILNLFSSDKPIWDKR
jgi:hypothetical protein